MTQDIDSYLEEGCDQYGLHNMITAYSQHESIWVIVDRMTKSSRFFVVKTTYSAEDYTRLYINEIVRLHEVPFYIISDRGPRFTSHF